MYAVAYVLVRGIARDAANFKDVAMPIEALGDIFDFLFAIGRPIVVDLPSAGCGHDACEGNHGDPLGTGGFDDTIQCGR